MRIESLTVLHYGAAYLRFALMSVLDHVDRAHIAYCPTPSHNHWTDEPCPETRDQLREVVAGLPKIEWHDVSFRHEGQHRDWTLAQCRGDLALVVDADEVWDGDVLEQVLKFAHDGNHRDTLVGCKTPWRSFNWLCEDPMQPVRVIKRAGSGVASYPPDKGWFWHFGYAVTDVIQHYKWLAHGHKDEMTPGWFEDKWAPWPPVNDVHPTGCGPWNPRPFNRRELPMLMRSHKWWDVEPIR